MPGSRNPFSEDTGMFLKTMNALPKWIPMAPLKAFRDGFMERGGECHRHDSTECFLVGFQNGFLQRCQDGYRNDAGAVAENPENATTFI